MRITYSLVLILHDWYFWAVVTPFIFWLGKRFPFEGKRSIKFLVLIHLPIGFLTAVAHLLLSAYVLHYWWKDTVSLDRVLIQEAGFFSHYFLFYVGILAVSLVFQYNRKYKERELLEATLKNELSQAQLQALQMQINPHFLFNTLNSISALMFKDVTAANSMLARLSDLLRISLSHDTIQEITLEQELNFLQTYLGIEQIRFQDRLMVHFDISPQTLEAYVPSLILQPLVENSIRHGVSKHRGRCIIEIRTCRLKGEKLLLEVCDNGLGTQEIVGATIKEGVGLSNTRSRLQKLYNDEQHFEFLISEKGEVKVAFIIPYRTNIYEQNTNIDR